MKTFALLFSGQASQYVGMGKALFDKYDFVKVLFEEANDTLGFDLKGLCFDGNLSELTKTENTQPALLLCSVAAYKAFQHKYQAQPKFVAGHSIGEISALTCVGAINFTDALNIVRQRGLFMKEAVPEGAGKMSAVANLDINLIEEVCRELSSPGNEVVVSNYNGRNQYVISGLDQNVKSVGNKLSEMGARVIPLNVSAPFHSPYMKPAANRFKEELTKYTFNNFDIPVISNIDALPYSDKNLIPEKLVTQLEAPVQWVKTVEFLYANGVDMVVELGPKAVLKNLVKATEPSIKAYAFDQVEDLAMLDKSIPDFVNKCMAISVCTRNYNWDDAEYKRGVSDNYSVIQKMAEELEAGTIIPDMSCVQKAYGILNTILDTKKVPDSERRMRIEELFENPVGCFLNM